LISIPQNSDKVDKVVLWYNKLSKQMVGAVHDSYKKNRFIKLNAEVELNLYIK
jgi:hypothetical protein